MKNWLLTPLVMLLFALAFVESWAALVHAAGLAGIPYPEPWPFMIDGFILASALLVVEARRMGHARGAWWPRLGLIGATALSTSIQALYAPQEGWAWTLHAWSPVAVLASFEVLIWLVFNEAPVKSRKKRDQDPALLRARKWLHAGVPELVPDVPVAQVQDVPGPDLDHVPVSQGQDVPMSQGHVPGPVSQRPRSNVPVSQRNVPASGPLDQEILDLAQQGHSGVWITKELGLTDRQRKERVGPLVKQVREGIQQPSMNGNKEEVPA